MKLGSLFSGGGLGDFGFMAAGMDIAWQCEIDEYCQKILALRYPESKKYLDIKTLKGGELEPIDILTGGFPCQPFSVAGNQAGINDRRNMWPEMFRVITELSPRWIIAENVPGIINMALESICSELEKKNYEVWTVVFPSHALGAWHKRDRVWIIGYAKHNGPFASKIGGSIKEGVHYDTERSKQTGQPAGPSKQFTSMANARFFPTGDSQNRPSDKRELCNTEEEWSEARNRFANGCENIWQRYWLTEPSVGRVANGITDRVHRLKMLGNGQVPACTYVIGKMIMDIENPSLLKD